MRGRDLYAVPRAGKAVALKPFIAALMGSGGPTPPTGAGGPPPGASAGGPYPPGVPPAVTIRPVTRKGARHVPTLAPYDFAMVQGRLLIVNPRDMIVAEVIRSPRKAAA